MILNSDLYFSHVIAIKFIKKSNRFRMRERFYLMRTLNTFSCSLPPLTHGICLMSSQRACSPLLSRFGVQGAARVHGKAMPVWTPLLWESPAGTQCLRLGAYWTRSCIVFFLKLAKTQGQTLTLLFHHYHGWDKGERSAFLPVWHQTQWLKLGWEKRKVEMKE